jgi:serine/threonine-protein kinase
MDTDPERRYPSAERLSADLTRYLEKRPVQARPITWAYRAERFVARNRVGVSFAAALVLVLAAGSAALAWQVRQVQQESRRNARLTEFLTRVMGLSYGSESSPVRVYGRNTRILDVIQYVDERLDKEMSGEPLLEARVRAGTGRVLMELGYLDEGERSLLRGLSLVDKRRDPALAGELTTTLARLHALQGALKGVLDECREGWRLVESAGAKAPLEVRLYAAWTLSDTLLGVQGATPESERMVERALELAAQIGTGSPAYALALYDRGALHMRKGQVAEAERDMQLSLDIQKRLPALGLEHYSGVAAVGIIHVAQAKPREGIALIEEAEQGYQDVLGENSSLVQNLRLADVRARMTLADSEMASGQFEEARNELSGALALAESTERDLPRVLPKARAIFAGTLACHGAILRRMGKDAEGQALILRGRDLVGEDLGADNVVYRSVAALLAAPAHVLPGGAPSRGGKMVDRGRRF